MAAASAVVDGAPASERPGALSRFLAWADTLPGHGWWLYPLFAGVLFAWAHAILWLSGLLPVGSIDLPVLVGVAYGPFGLASLAYINRVAARALATFWPATGWPEADRPAWTARLVTTPGGYGWACLVVGVILAIGSFLGAPPDVLLVNAGNPVPSLVAFMPLLVFGYTALPAGIVHIARQLSVVSRIHHAARAIDPFDRVPLYAFSRLTAQAGLVFVVVAMYSLTVNGAFQSGNVASILGIVAGLVLGLACFVVPLWGMHDRLVEEKELLLRDVERRLASLGSELFRRIDAGAFDGTKVVSEALAGVLALRERIARLPTWPWAPNLFRGFISALLLPVIVYLVSRVIGGRIGA